MRDSIVSPHKAFSLCLHLLDVATAWHLEIETSHSASESQGAGDGQPKLPKRNLSHGVHQLQGTFSHQPWSSVVALGQLDMHKKVLGEEAEEALEQAWAVPMITPPLLPEPAMGSVQFSKDFAVQSQGSDFADGFVASVCADCKTRTDLEVLKAALPFSNCLNSTHHLCLIKKYNF